MANLTKCTSCDTCNACLSCNSCNNCNGSCQNLAQKISSKVGTFCFRTNTATNRLSSNDLFLSKTEWDNFLDKIKAGYDLNGSPHNGFGSGVYTYNSQNIKASANDFMSANMYNGAIAKMRYVSEGDGTPGEKYFKTGGPNGDIIKAQYFTDLEDYFNDSFKSIYCDSCNNCQGCNSCNSCESGQCTESTYCCKCDQCQSNDKPAE